MERLPLPIRGVNAGITVSVTPAEFTTNINNVRPRDVQASRIRLGQRPGLAKWSADQVGGSSQPVVFITSVSSVT